MPPLFANPEYRTTLTRLGDAMLPIGVWAAGRPAPWPAAPWRKTGAAPLSVHSLRLLDAIERFANDDDPSLDTRWAGAAKSPFALLEVPADGLARWMAYERGLNPGDVAGTTALFRMDAKSWPTVVNPKDLEPKQTTLPLFPSRRGFYAACENPLLDTVRAMTPPADPAAPSIDWASFSKRLLRGESFPATWPVTPIPTDRFARTFLRDLTIALLAFKNSPANPSYQDGPSVELDESRRPGNRYTRADVDAARISFESILHAKGIR
jgi:hypothetical protein